MFTSKLKALDSDESEDSASLTEAPAVTREALEQRALLQYQDALQMLHSGRLQESQLTLETLLDSHILSVSYVEDADLPQKTSFSHLKYCVALNLGHCLVEQGKLDESLDYYLMASRLEDSDLNLWYKMGRVAVKLPDLKLAASAFTQGLKISPKHWGCLDNLVTVLYALGDHLTCLYFIMRGLDMDPDFTKGHVFMKAILFQSPYLKSDFSLFYSGQVLKDEFSKDINERVESQLLREAEELCEKEKACWSMEPTLPDTSPCIIPGSYSWDQLTFNILRAYQREADASPKSLAYKPVEFNLLTVPMDTGLDNVEVVKESSHSEASTEAVGKQDDEAEEPAKSGAYEKWLSCQKRRSARVRSTVRREEPSLARSLAHLVPSHLLQRSGYNGLLSEDSLETMDLYRLFEFKESETVKTYRKNIFTSDERKKALAEQGYFGSCKEADDVQSFMMQVSTEKLPIVDCIEKCLTKMSTFWSFLWPDSMTKTYLHLFKIFMKQNSPNILRGNDKRTVDDDLSILMYGELLLDKWLEKGKQKGRAGPLGSSLLGGDFPSLYLGVLDRRALISSDAQLRVRIFWLQGILFYYLREADPTTVALEMLLSDNTLKDLQVELPNVRQHYIINSSIVSDILKSLNINKCLSRVQVYYDNEAYEDIVEILSESLLSEQVMGSGSSDYVITRFRQFALLIDSLWRMSKYKECFYWSESFLYDCLTEYKQSTVEEERASNACHIVTLMNGILSIIDTVGNIVFGTLPLDRQSRFVQTLSSIICLQMDVPETVTEMCIESIAPWLLLYHVIKYDEESKEKGSAVNYGGPWAEGLPSSLSLLHQGHDYLGRRGWCCFNEGSLLYFSLDVMFPLINILDPESKAMPLINQEIDQIFFCLYGQQKKSKGRYLVDHKTLGLAMTWNRARQVFRFTKPKQLPSYDSGGKCSINSDTESMYLKLISFVPEECDPSRAVPDMTKYLEGETEDFPPNICQLPEDITNIFYLLAHFYFRNKYWNKALKFYMLDVCANPSRVDSWACLALARGSLIDTKINSCDVIKNENDILKSADIVSRCYGRSLRLDPLQSTLWIEKGSFSYTIYSFCSNLLKKEVNLSLEMFDILENKKEFMLNSAMDSFSKANNIWYSCQGVDIQDERWLHHYMMGKICEKQGNDPAVCIDHYLKAAELLHEMGALYPYCISYAAPQRLAVESLEIYYRIHASALKFLEKYECKEFPKESFLVYKRAVEKMAVSAFVQHCQTSKEDLTKSEITPAKESRKVDSDDPYSPGDIMVDLSQSNSLFKTHEININSISVKQHMKSTFNPEPATGAADVQPANECSIQSTQPKPENSESILSSISSYQNVQDINIEAPVKSLPLEPVKKVLVKEGEACKRLAIAESDALTSDSMSKASFQDKPSKSSDSSSDSTSSDSDSSSDSSSSDSSSSSSNQDSESNLDNSVKKTGVEEQPKPVDWETEYDHLIKDCLKAMEICAHRFQEHFKSLYHLAYFYFKSKKHKDLLKVKHILLETKGLFAERKSSNFFNGIWRIPNNEIDRPGNFAAHMGRCTQLLLEYLKETRDYKMLIDLALFLKLVPDADKKYLRDTERDELCHEALSLAAISMRKRLAEIAGEPLLKPFLIDVFSIYKKVSRSCLKEPVFTTILGEAFYKLSGQKSDTNLESDVQLYLKKDQQSSATPEKVAEKLPLISSSITIEPIPLPATVVMSKVPAPAPTPLPVLTPPQITSQLVKPTVPPPQTAPLDLQTKSPTIQSGSSRGRGIGPKRPRGRPPGSFSQPLRHSITSILQQRPDMFLPVDPYRPKTRPNLSITPVAPRPRKPRASSQVRPQVPIPPSISITSVTSQPRPFTFQSVSISPRPRQPPPEQRLPPASIIPLPVQQPQQQSPAQLKPRPRPPVVGSRSLPSTGSKPPVGPRIPPTIGARTPPAVGLRPSPIMPPRPTPPIMPPRPTPPIMPPRPTPPIMSPRPTPSIMPPRPSPPVGPSPPKIPNLDYNVAQAIRNLGSTITITTSTGESSRSKTLSVSQGPQVPLSKSAHSSQPSLPVTLPSVSSTPQSSSSQPKDSNIQVIILDD